MRKHARRICGAIRRVKRQNPYPCASPCPSNCHAHIRGGVTQRSCEQSHGKMNDCRLSAGIASDRDSFRKAQNSAYRYVKIPPASQDAGGIFISHIYTNQNLTLSPMRSPISSAMPALVSMTYIVGVDGPNVWGKEEGSASLTI